MKYFHRTATLSAAIAIATFGCVTAGAQVPPPASPAVTTGGTTAGTSSQLAASQQFVDQAAHANRAEILEGRYMVNHASSGAVKGFATKMIHDHTLAQDQLRQIASSAGLKVPAGVSGKDRQAFSQLKDETGARLDRAYADSQTQDHQKVIARFMQAENAPALLPAVRDYARKTLPTLQAHLRMSKQLVAVESKDNHSAG